MPASFEAQRELISTFQSVARSLLASEEPVQMKDLDGNLLRSRVRTVMNRLIEIGFVEETKERGYSNHYMHLVWRLVDDAAVELLTRVVEDRVQTSKLLWPDEEPEQEPEESEVELVVPANEWKPSEDPVSLVAAVLEGYNDRLSAMEQRVGSVDDKMGQVAGDMSELVVAVGKVAAKPSPKFYDDTELLLGVTEQNELLKALLQQGEKHKELLENHVQAATGLIKVVESLGQVTTDATYALNKLLEDGVQAKNKEMQEDILVMMKAFGKMTASFKSWTPAMEECIGGLKIVNKNQLQTGREMTEMQTAVIQALSSLENGRGGTIEVKQVSSALPLKRTLRQGRGLPSLTQMVAKKDQEKEDASAVLPNAITRMVEEVGGLGEVIAEKKAKVRELEAQNQAAESELDRLASRLTEEERKQLVNKAHEVGGKQAADVAIALLAKQKGG